MPDSIEIFVHAHCVFRQFVGVGTYTKIWPRVLFVTLPGMCRIFETKGASTYQPQRGFSS